MDSKNEPKIDEKVDGKSDEKNAAKIKINVVKKVYPKEDASILYVLQRVVAFIAFFMIFMPGFNPARVSGLINRNMSLFTSAISYKRLVADTGRAFRMAWVSESVFVIDYIGAILIAIGVIAVAGAACSSLGNRKMKHLSAIITVLGSIVGIVGVGLEYYSFTLMQVAPKADKVEAIFSNGIILFSVVFILMLVFGIVTKIVVPKPQAGEEYDMETRFKLFIMFLPFALLAFVFCYLPLWGWRYAFFDYQAGGALTSDNFVGMKWFTYLFQNEATRRDIVRVMTNTLAMSGLGIATSWIPLAFAIFLTEINNKYFKRFVQTFTTIPNFISWILVYTIALAIFSTDGFINTFAMSRGWISQGTNYLMSDSYTWVKMLAWGVWKGTGWGAIIYISGIAGIDKQLYEAATVDGAGRFQRMWHITLPGLVPTYMVMLLMSVAGMLSNGLDQYLVFSNARNAASIEVLDLYVYNLGIGGGSIPLSTVIGMAKSVVSVVLLFFANGISKSVRGESIV